VLAPQFGGQVLGFVVFESSKVELDGGSFSDPNHQEVAVGADNGVGPRGDL
jgi:hypothetical protein